MNSPRLSNLTRNSSHNGISSCIGSTRESSSSALTNSSSSPVQSSKIHLYADLRCGNALFFGRLREIARRAESPLASFGEGSLLHVGKAIAALPSQKANATVRVAVHDKTGIRADFQDAWAGDARLFACVIMAQENIPTDGASAVQLQYIRPMDFARGADGRNRSRPASMMVLFFFFCF
jgi:hypothetical protein